MGRSTSQHPTAARGSFDACRISRRAEPEPSCTIEAMTVPSRTEAASLLLSLHPPAWHVRHSRAVAEVAAWLAVRITARGTPIDRRLVEAAALLHDVDKVLPATDRARRLPHGEGSAAWVTRNDAGELGEAIAGHPITRLAGPDGARWLAEATLEARVVSYADKRAGRRLGPMSARFARWSKRRPRGWSDPGGTARARAELLELGVCDLAGVEPAAVRRLRWVDAALARAAAR
jgi:HD domain